MVFFSFDFAEKRSKYSRYLWAYPATSRPSIGNGLVRITWSGVAGPCWESFSRSGRRAKLQNFSVPFTFRIIGKPAWSDIARLRFATSSRLNAEADSLPTPSAPGE